MRVTSASRLRRRTLARRSSSWLLRFRLLRRSNILCHLVQHDEEGRFANRFAKLVETAYTSSEAKDGGAFTLWKLFQDLIHLIPLPRIAFGLTYTARFALRIAWLRQAWTRDAVTSSDEFVIATQVVATLLLEVAGHISISCRLRVDDFQSCGRCAKRCSASFP